MWQTTLVLSSKSFQNSFANLLLKRPSCSANPVLKECMIIRRTRASLFNGYGSIIQNSSSFGSYHPGRKFINYDIVMCGHDNRGSIVARYMKQQLHDLV